MSEPRAAAWRDPNTSGVAVLITLVACLASALLAQTAVSGYRHVEARPTLFLIFLAATAALQFASIEVYGRGTLSFSGAGMLAIGFAFGVGAAIPVAAVMTLVIVAVRRPKFHRAIFDAGQFALAAAAGTAVYEAFPSHWGTAAHLAPATLASAAFGVVNVGLLCLAMSLSEGIDPRAIWAERFRWRTPYYLFSGPLALALTVAYDKVGFIGTLAFTLPPAMMMISVRQYTRRTQRAVEEIRAANDELRQSNADLQDLFQFAAGLAAQTHGKEALTVYAQDALERLVGAHATVSVGGANEDATQIELSGRVVGGIELEGGDAERWARLSEAIVPQLATAFESALLVEEVRKTHLDTIAALSRSMEAKDYYTGGHTERVSSIAVALATRLGYDGSELDAIEIGALLHDIGKIGIPERILHKEGPLDDEDWVVMKKHPVISEFILSEIDLPSIVLQIARSSHERIDGCGYPDGLAGDDVPVPARIVLVADAYDALTSDRPYRRARLPLAALDEIRAHAGTQFCPRVVEALERIFRKEPGVLGIELVAVA